LDGAILTELKKLRLPENYLAELHEILHLLTNALKEDERIL
jgi:hypothetical protein